ncbi:MAG: NAD(+) diphosphatase [Defluviimonas sp.]|nr:NAD(+) diphosphatase [Defluviimonas sp.]
MQYDERDLAFAGGGLDRAGHLRGDAAAMAALLADPGTRVLPFWRGKPLLADAPEGGQRLGLLMPGHPALAGAGAPMLLGLAGGAARLAVDISAWEPVGEVAMPGSFIDPAAQAHPDLPADHRFADLRGVMTVLDALEAELAATARSLLAWHGAHGFCSACGAASAPEKGGWQRGCPACGAEHFPRTDPVVIMLVTRGNRTLLGRSPGWPPGMYSCLAGFVEPGETLEAAVRREVLEETGVQVGAVRYVASQPWPFPSSLMMGCQGAAETEALKLDPAEIEDALWLTREEMAEVFAGAHPVVRRPRQGPIAGHLLRMWLADRLI